MPESQGYILPEPSWDLRILVQDLQVERVLRVKGDMSIGTVMLRLTEELGLAADWSDHAFWWPKLNCWLMLTKSTLNHYGIQADSLLIFTTMHKPLRVQLPDLRFIDANVNFAVKCATAVRQLCKELGLRCGEEVSFCRPLSQEHLRKNYQKLSATPAQRPFSNKQQMNTNTLSTIHKGYSPYNRTSNTLDTRSRSPDISSTLSRHASYRGFTTTYSTAMLAEDLKNLEISNSPHSPSAEAKSLLLYPKTLTEKARMNAGWLDSSLSLFEQDVRDSDTLQLRFKYLEFYDLNPKLDIARINQIYEQAKWSILTEEIDCTDGEKSMFSGLQYKIQQQAGSSLPGELNNVNDNIDAMLNELQAQLEGGGGGGANDFETRAYRNVGASRILENHSNVSNLTSSEAKLQYIKAWKALPNFGIHMFVVRFTGSSKDEIIGIASDRLVRIDPYNGDHLRVWPFSRMKSWNVNWEVKQIFLQFEDGSLSFSVLSADCKVPHEFIGGYIFLSMRSKDNNQTLNEDLFHKLTGGWI